LQVAEDEGLPIADDEGAGGAELRVLVLAFKGAIAAEDDDAVVWRIEEGEFVFADELGGFGGDEGLINARLAERERHLPGDEAVDHTVGIGGDDFAIDEEAAGVHEVIALEDDFGSVGEAGGSLGVAVDGLVARIEHEEIAASDSDVGEHEVGGGGEFDAGCRYRR
jgi:hypothetical protein